MNEGALIEQTADTVEESLRDALASGDAVLATARPVLLHLVNNDRDTLFNDEIIARVRGILHDIARQWLLALAEAAQLPHRDRFVEDRIESCAAGLSENAELLAHAHVLTLEAQLTDRLLETSGVDPVLTALIQDEAAGSDAVLAGLAMAVLAAQARFMRQQARMALPLAELPGELFHQVVVTLMCLSADHAEPAARAAARLRADYAEGQSRLGALSRFVAALGTRTCQALAVEEAGLAIFSTALATLVHQERDLIILSFSERQKLRLGLALRAAELSDGALREQFNHIHPRAAVPQQVLGLSADRAAALLAAASPYAGDPVS
ncbi:hypothetical protein GRI97_12995 [Altererythrobacter xixiisoli]|uniref:DUF2336 domain-containing protein n=1 Tax=Croceibacterium xixiisoli TaxID=1476466 RepID=A0A6I4TVB6_9SPHN|nr:hypothetical protein [Croceibacterium xixiisoli]MXO99904.1 hypothetical protein [Croceibacterium xixiisoli]